MVDVLLLCREHAAEVVELAVRGALAAGAHDGRAVALLVDRSARPQPAALEIDARLGRGSARRHRPTSLSYDQLRDRRPGDELPAIRYCHAEAFIEHDAGRLDRRRGALPAASR